MLDIVVGYFVVMVVILFWYLGVEIVVNVFDCWVLLSSFLSIWCKWEFFLLVIVLVICWWLIKLIELLLSEKVLISLGSFLVLVNDWVGFFILRVICKFWLLESVVVSVKVV